MPLPLSDIAQIVIQLPASGTQAQNFNEGLIIGTSTVVSTTTRVVEYASLAAMATAGFSLSSPEYLAATMYFGAQIAPTKVAIGRQGSGETCVQALTACRAANQNWYAAYIPGAVDADHAACAAYVETLTQPFSTYFVGSNASAVAANTGGNLFLTLSGSKYERTFGEYSTTAYAAAAAMGDMLGRTSTLAGSYCTANFKTHPGVTADNLTTAQVGNIQGNNGNMYVNYGGISMLKDGRMFSGHWWDTRVYLDMLSSITQTNLVNLLAQSPAVALDESGMSLARGVCAQACEALRSIGFISTGQWNGPNLLTLTTGDTLQGGYRIMSDPVSSLSSGNRAARQAPNIYMAINPANAIHSALIKIPVNA